MADGFLAGELRDGQDMGTASQAAVEMLPVVGDAVGRVPLRVEEHREVVQGNHRGQVRRQRHEVGLVIQVVAPQPAAAPEVGGAQGRPRCAQAVDEAAAQTRTGRGGSRRRGLRYGGGASPAQAVPCPVGLAHQGPRKAFDLVLTGLGEQAAQQLGRIIPHPGLQFEHGQGVENDPHAGTSFRGAGFQPARADGRLKTCPTRVSRRRAGAGARCVCPLPRRADGRRRGCRRRSAPM